MSGTIELGDLVNRLDTETVLAVRQHALDLAIEHRTGGYDDPAERRKRITQDADAWTQFVLAGKIYGS